MTNFMHGHASLLGDKLDHAGPALTPLTWPHARSKIGLELIGSLYVEIACDIANLLNANLFATTNDCGGIAGAQYFLCRTKEPINKAASAR